MLLDPKIPALDVLLPRRCLACGVDVPREIICEACRSLCNLCPNPTFGRNPNEPGAVFYYEFTIKEIIRRAKFEKSIPAAHLLLALVKAELLRSELVPQISAFAPEAVAFVPAHWAKRLFHSVHLPLLFARSIAQILQIPVAEVLIKNRHGFTQSAIARRAQRQEDIKGVFSPKKGAKVYKKLLLVDDIVTTGATFDETRKMLQGLGSKLWCVAMAKTP